MPNVRLRAVLRDGTVEIVDITGNSAPHLRRGSGEHVFTFSLDDDTGLDVEFCEVDEGLLIAEDNGRDCPPRQNSSGQIDDVARLNPRTAKFRDRNDNEEEDMPVSYALYFKCNRDSKQRPMFDPIIINGGRMS